MRLYSEPYRMRSNFKKYHRNCHPSNSQKTESKRNAHCISKNSSAHRPGDIPNFDIAVSSTSFFHFAHDLLFTPTPCYKITYQPADCELNRRA